MGLSCAASSPPPPASGPRRNPCIRGGTQVGGTLVRTGAVPAWGVRRLGEPGRDPLLVRLSCAIGLPERWPDILGLAVRVQGDSGGDLLFATTGRGWVADHSAGSCSYRGERPTGAWRPPALSDAERADDPRRGARDPARRECCEWTAHLAAASPRDPWRRFGILELALPTSDHDPLVSFDPMLNPVPGLPPTTGRGTPARARTWRRGGPGAPHSGRMGRSVLPLRRMHRSFDDTMDGAGQFHGPRAIMPSDGPWPAPAKGRRRNRRRRPERPWCG